jgi:hypothetical protein
MSRAIACSGVRVIVAVAAMLSGVIATSSTVASAAGAMKFDVKLQPKKLGKSTTVTVGFTVPTVKGELPSPLISFDVRLPAGMGLATATLGVDTCSAETLIRDGVGSCPRDALMGSGSAVAEAAFGSEIIEERGHISSFMTQARDENTTLLYYFDGKVPVITPQIFPSEFLSPGNSPISELATSLPLIPGLPGTPDAAIVSMQVSLGPNHLTYFKRVGKKVVSYKPSGMEVPASCPKGGFRFTGAFVFADGTHLSAAKNVKCP